MIPDYLTFIRFQDKRNLIYIYAIGLILIGFYWKNAGFTFPSEDIGVVSGILALVLYNFIFDLKAYWASTLVICAVPDFVTWAVGHLSAVSDDPHQLCQAGRYFSSEKSKI